MANVSMKSIINAPAKEVWATISDFNGLPNYIEAVVESRLEGEGVGSVRTFSLADGTVIIEKLLRIDNEARSLTYSILESALPMDDYMATMDLTGAGDSSCQLHWHSTFGFKKDSSEEQAVKTVEGVYSLGFAGLKKLHES